jgi:alpha-tubulin suppressor-like RCC1 family protein
LKVTPSGDDAGASMSQGATPFRTVQAAIDFAAAHANAAQKVCVAGGAACGSTVAHAGPTGAALTMRDGVSVYGSYDEGTWTRCDNTTTSLVLTHADGVSFGSDLNETTALDRFEVVRAQGTVTRGVTIDGSTNVELVGLTITGPSTGVTLFGIDIRGGAEVLLRDVEVQAVSASTGTVGVSCDRSLCVIEESSIAVAAEAGADAQGVWFEDAPGSTIAETVVVATGNGADAVTGVHVAGDATGTSFSGGSISSAGGTLATAIVFDGCASSAPAVTESQLSAQGSGSIVAAAMVSDECNVLFARNVLQATGAGATTTIGVACSASANEPGCVLVDNTIGTSNPLSATGTDALGYGVSCAGGGGCAEIRGNTITALGTPGNCRRVCTYEGIGIDLVSGDTLVDSNIVSAGCVDRGVGIRVATNASARIENNLVFGRHSDAACGTALADNVLETTGVEIHGSASVDVHSNTIRGGGSQLPVSGCYSMAISLRADGGSFRNNILHPGVCPSRNGFAEGTAADPFAPTGDPAILQNNDFESTFGYPASGERGAIYLDEGATNLSTAAAVNALIGASGNFSLDPLFVPGSSVYYLSASSPCIGAGVTDGAPDHDRDGDTRAAPFDVGADEWSSATGPPHPCAGQTCSGHGTCSASGNQPVCSCDAGYQHPNGDQLACEEDGCYFNNGGCDPLTTCTDTSDGRTCGPCPPQYSGTGETGCVPLGPCNPNPCSVGASCFETAEGTGCDCPPGVFGALCDEGGIADLASGGNHTCGRRTTGQLACWGANHHGQSQPPVGFFLAVSSGLRHSCAIQGASGFQGPIQCWGANDKGQLDAPSGDFVLVAAGGDHNCAQRVDGTIACWGDNANGQTTVPNGLLGGGLAAGRANTCVLVRGAGTITCFGANESGQSTPASGNTFAALALGDAHGCARKNDGTVTCWGDNGDGQATAPSGNFTSLSAQGDTSCALSSGGALTCWGSNVRGAATPPTGTHSKLSVGGAHGCAATSTGVVHCWGDDRSGQSHPPGGAFTRVSVGAEHGCALTAAGSLRCWGTDEVGQTMAPSGAFSAVAVGAEFSCGLRNDEAILCWGDDTSGQATAPAGTFAVLSAGDAHGCAIDTTGAALCWGDAGAGQGDEPPGTFNFVASGGDHSCALDSGGVVSCWGSDGSNESSPPPEVFQFLALASLHSCGVRDTGALVCWGGSGGGQSSAPGGSFESIATASGHTCGIRPGGALDCWGDNTYGAASAPSGTFAQASVASGQSCVIGTDLRLHCFGKIVH